MKSLFIVLLVLFVLSLAAFCILRDAKGSVKALLVKTLTSILFMVTAFCFASVAAGTGTLKPVFFTLLVSGLLMGLIGDILLDLKFVDKVNADTYTFGGMGVFAVGHILFLSALIYLFAPTLPVIFISAGIAVILALLIMVVSIKVMKFNFGKFLIPAASYSFLLIFFAALSVAVLINNRGGAFDDTAWLLAIGSVIFFLSDAVLSSIYFGGKNNKLLIALNHILYYAAQLLIVYSLGIAVVF